ncbi:prepilin peptidase [Pseudoteredinibacter isoporae]|uniref:Prepilin leader peptidase/N-methyltransferase n=1 Tax=Pseudoteredinibacter isoporae TaxID=570281 RepID=A0A7X0JWC1_9GAMM|nr:A24 family peptidase [Pseudoteredinibacter isoporae]MBB6522715.1 leader peptidase (prepilin peptidase)/N-methyltransferase [Pseudoteredinibacter isoporae]NHO88245.1 prepilin peptidase [Pseudoteredinibacter isoporae]NIB23424.1 prepilin peptidase [Pseudoteredinibacter isoporae]
MLQDVFTLYPGALVGVICILGLLVGSFLNVAIYRLPKMLEREWKQSCCEILEQEAPKETEAFNLVVPASTCPSCEHKIRAWENIPVISYVFLRGRCSQCSSPISVRYPIIEAVTALLSAVLAMKFGFTWQLAAALLFTWSLITLTMIDIDTQLLPDNITLPLLWLGLIVNSQSLFSDLPNALWGAVFGYLSLWSVYWVFKLLTGKEGMGYGDFKLLGALGAWMGWQALPLTILLSSVVGAVIGIAGIIIMGRDKNVPMPFGPYLAIAGWIYFMWGDSIVASYLSLM